MIGAAKTCSRLVTSPRFPPGRPTCLPPNDNRPRWRLCVMAALDLQLFLDRAAAINNHPKLMK